MRFLRQVIASQYYFFTVVPQVGRVISMRLALTIVPEKFVKAFAVGLATGAYHTEPPLSEGPRNITRPLQQLGKRLYGVGQGLLPLGLYFLITTNVGVSGMLAGEEC